MCMLGVHVICLHVHVHVQYMCIFVNSVKRFFAKHTCICVVSLHLYMYM